MDNFKIDEKEFNLFKKYNNEIERGIRKKNFFYLDDPKNSEEDVIKLAEKNEKNMFEDSIEQINNYPKLFDGDGIC